MKLSLTDAELAILEHHRTWMFSNCHSYRGIRSDDEDRIKDAIQKICLEYGVHRGKEKRDPGTNENKAVELVYQVLKETNIKGCTSFSAKRKYGVELLYELRRIYSSKGDGVKPGQTHWLSGASKVLWFWSPVNWTLYDNIATLGQGAKGTDSPKKKDGREYRRFCSYYDAIETPLKEFRNALDEDKDGTCKKPGLFPERIFDKFNFIQGLKKKDQGVGYTSIARLLETYKSLLPNQIQCRIYALSKTSSIYLEPSKEENQ